MKSSIMNHYVLFDSGSAHGSSSCAALFFFFSFGPTSGWWLKMISMSLTGKSDLQLFHYVNVMLFVRGKEMAGCSRFIVFLVISFIIIWRNVKRPLRSVQSDLITLHTGVYTTDQESGRMRHSPSLHPPLWDSATSPS